MPIAIQEKYPQQASYTVYKVGSTYYAQPSRESGLTPYSGEDASTVINNTIASNRKILLKDTFDITGSSISVNNINGLWLCGIGASGSILRQIGTVTGSLPELIKISTGSHIIISDMLIQGVGDPLNLQQDKQGIRIIAPSSDIWLNRLGFKTIDGAIIRIEPRVPAPASSPTSNRIFISEILDNGGNSAGGITFDTVTDATLANSHLYTWDATLTIARSIDIRVKNNYLRAQSARAIDVLTHDSTDIMRQLLFDSNFIKNGSGYAFDYHGVALGSEANISEVKIVNNLFEPALIGINFSLFGKTGSEILISGNTIKSPTSYGIYLLGNVSGSFKNSHIIGNQIIDGQVNGIFLQMTGTVGIMENIHIDNNTLLRNGKGGSEQIAISAYGLKNSTINSNIINDNQAVPTQIIGIEVGTNSSRVSVQNNIIRGTTTSYRAVGSPTNILFAGNIE